MAKLDRLDQDETQALCSQYGTKAPPKDVAERIEKANLAPIKSPADGKYLGDWKRGEQIAQRGTGFQFIGHEGDAGRRATAMHATSSSKAEIATARSARRSTISRKLRGFTPEMREVRVGQGVQRAGVLGVLEHAALRSQRHPDRAADQGRRRAADGSGVAGER